MVSESSDLKYFGPVSEKTGQAANYTSDVASKVYTTVKQKSPESAQPYFKLAEDKFSEYGSPILTTVQDKSGKFVQIADEQVSFRCWSSCHDHVWACQTYKADGTVLLTTDGFTDLQVDGAANGVFSFHDKHYPVFQQTKDQYLKAVEERFASLKENGIGGSVGQATDAAKQLPGYVNKQTEVALDRVEDAFNRVTSLPIGEAAPTQICRSRYGACDTGTVAFLHFVHLLSSRANLLLQVVMFDADTLCCLQCKECGDRQSPQQTTHGSSTLASIISLW